MLKLQSCRVCTAYEDGLSIRPSSKWLISTLFESEHDGSRFKVFCLEYHYGVEVCRSPNLQCLGMLSALMLRISVSFGQAQGLLPKLNSDNCSCSRTRSKPFELAALDHGVVKEQLHFLDRNNPRGIASVFPATSIVIQNRRLIQVWSSEEPGFPSFTAVSKT